MFEKDLSTLSTIPEKSINHLSDYINCIHSHSVVTQLVDAKSNIIDIEIFEGTIRLQLVDDEIKYKFIPNEKFETMLVNTITTKKSLLVDKLEEKLKSVLSSAYKDVL